MQPVRSGTRYTNMVLFVSGLCQAPGTVSPWVGCQLAEEFTRNAESQALLQTQESGPAF